MDTKDRTSLLTGIEPEEVDRLVRLPKVKPVWLLDIDGVVNAVDYVGRNRRFAAWSESSWMSTEILMDSIHYPITVAIEVRDFIIKVHDNNMAEIRWHTTWQESAHLLSTFLGLPEFPIQPSPEFSTWDTTWWKLPAAKRVLFEEQRRLIWTDDDLDRELRSQQVTKFIAAGVLLICPKTHTGLTAKDLDRIERFINPPAESEVVAS